MIIGHTNTVIAARKEYMTIESCIRELYDIHNPLNAPEGNLMSKEDLIKHTYTEIMSILSAICFDHSLNDSEMQIIGASDEYEVSYTEESGAWISKRRDGNTDTYPVPKFLRIASTVDFKYSFNGKNTKVVFNSLMKIIEMICEADDDYKKYMKKARVACEILEPIYLHTEAKGIFLRDRPLITSKRQINENIAALDRYLCEMDNVINREFALERIKKGTCFVATKGIEGYRFYPSRFIGYKSNSRHIHELNDKDGRITNRAIKDVLKKSPIFSQEMEDEYYKYCNSLRIKASDAGAWGVQRKYWVLE